MISQRAFAIKYLSVTVLLIMSHLATTRVDAQMSNPFASAITLSPLSLQAPMHDESHFQPAFDQDHRFSPVDTLKMSPWERIWWGRHGVMRLGFRLDEKNPVNDLRQMAKVRRKMLGLHQAMGLATIVSMGVTVTGGFRAAAGKGNGLHNTSLPITEWLYATTATLALVSPPKLVRSRGQWDTIRVHRLLAALHIAGMIVTPMLAPDDEGGKTSVKWHRAVGVATFATFSTSMLVVMLFH
jgi:hypothetical protein